MPRTLRFTGLVALLFALAIAPACSPHRSVTAPVPSEDGSTRASLTTAPADDPGLEPFAPQSPERFPPSVRITSPQPNPLFLRIFPPNATVQWESTDPDGPGPDVKEHFYRIIREDDPDYLPSLIQPDSLRRKYSPDFPGWTRLRGNVTSLVLPDLEPNERNLFVITAVDRRGADDPIYSLAKNMLVFMVVPAEQAEAPVQAGAPADGSNGGGRRR